MAVDVKIPSGKGSAAYVNPYKLDLDLNGAVTNGSVFSDTLQITNKTQVPIAASVQVTPTLKKGLKLAATEAQAENNKKEPMVFVYVPFIPDTIEAQPVAVQDTYGAATSKFDYIYDVNDVGDGTAAVLNLGTWKACNSQVKTRYTTFAVMGTASNPSGDGATPWTNKHKVNLKFVYTFSPRQGDNKTYGVIQFVPGRDSIPATVTDPITGTAYSLDTVITDTSKGTFMIPDAIDKALDQVSVPGYRVKEWYTLKTDGTLDKKVSANGTVDAGANVTTLKLAAKWESIKQTKISRLDGMDTNKKYGDITTSQLRNNLGFIYPELGEPTKTGYTFAGWTKTQPTGGLATPSTAFVRSGDGDTSTNTSETIYAAWTKDTRILTVILDPGAAGSTMTKSPAYYTGEFPATSDVSWAIGARPTSKDYVFDGYVKATGGSLSDGSGTITLKYDANGLKDLVGTETTYTIGTKWKQNAISLSFMKGFAVSDGKNVAVSDAMIVSTPTTFPSNVTVNSVNGKYSLPDTVPAAEGYSFLGWTLTAYGKLANGTSPAWAPSTARAARSDGSVYPGSMVSTSDVGVNGTVIAEGLWKEKERNVTIILDCGDVSNVLNWPTADAEIAFTNTNTPINRAISDSGWKKDADAGADYAWKTKASNKAKYSDTIISVPISSMSDVEATSVTDSANDNTNNHWAIFKGWRVDSHSKMNGDKTMYGELSAGSDYEIKLGDYSEDDVTITLKAVWQYSSSSAG